MTYQYLLYETGQGICTITFNRPKVLNALSSALLTEFSEALDMASADPDVRVLILTGAGEKSFVAGADIKELALLDALSARIFAKQGQETINKLQQIPVPVIAAVNGFALGGGLEIALACDFIYAADSARFGQPEINLGLIPGFGGSQRLPRLVGKNRAKELIFTGKMILAPEARETGLVNAVFPLERLMEEVRKTASLIAGKGSVSLQAAKEAVNRGMDVDLASGCSIEIDAFSLCMASEDFREGTTAFIEKRAPEFRVRR